MAFEVSGTLLPGGIRRFCVPLQLLEVLQNIVYVHYYSQVMRVLDLPLEFVINLDFKEK